MTLNEIKVWFRENRYRGAIEINRDINFTVQVFENVMELINTEIAEPMYLDNPYVAHRLNIGTNQIEAHLNYHKKLSREMGLHREATYKMFQLVFDYLRNVRELGGGIYEMEAFLNRNKSVCSLSKHQALTHTLLTKLMDYIERIYVPDAITC